jgi:signal transduction histidine kinase/CheY-like chemotaxis protein
MQFVTSQGFARPLRVVATLVAVTSALWEATSLGTGERLTALISTRAAEAAVAVVIAALSTPARSVRTLQILCFALGLDVVLASMAVLAIRPDAVWEVAVIVSAVVLGAALFAPWAWQWQAGLAGIATVATIAMVIAVVPRSTLPWLAVPRLAIILVTVAAVSVLGSMLAERGRRQIEAAVAERRAQEERRGHEQRLDALGRFAGGIAHQFNNLLGGILTHASVLRQDATQAGAAAELDEIAAAARRGRDLTEELLRFTRSGPVRLEPTDPAQTIASVARLARALLGDEATVDVLVPPGLPPIAADRDSLIHAATQVVLNARDAMRGRPKTGLILSAAEERIAQGDPAPHWPDVAPGRYVRLSIADTGRGMDPATLERVFEPFFTTKPMHEAKGLGLATVHRVMRDHAGAVRVESAIGSGTTVHLLLPVSTEPLLAPEPSAAPARSPLPTPSSIGAMILVVDDEPIVRSSLKRALTRLGHQVLEAGDGASALAAMRAATPPVDLVILDLVLPGGGAGIFELIKAVRPEVKVLISSGYSPDGDASRGLASRVEGFLPKPYELSQLREAVTRALGA